jgi:YD repeat-containing protein
MYIWNNNRHGVSRTWAFISSVSITILLSYGHASAQQSKINYFYDDLGRLVRVVDETGNAATYHYDGLGNILRITRETGVPNTTAVTRLSSSSVDRGTTTTITIDGFNFSCSSLVATTPGVTLSNAQILLDQIVLTVTISPTAQVGSAALQLECDRGPVTVPFSIIDTAPTVIITSPAEQAIIFEATEITLTAQAADNLWVSQVVWTVNGTEFPPVFAPPYGLTVSIPFGTTSVTVTATAKDNIGQNGSATRVIAVQPDPPPTVVITSPSEGAILVEGQQVVLKAAAADNRQVVSVMWSIDGIGQPPVSIPPYQFVLTVPTNITAFTIQATATDDFGRTGTAARTVSVIPDPRTTVVGQIIDANNQPVGGATVKVFEQFTAQSLADGSFSIPGVPTVRGDIAVVATAEVAGVPFRGTSIALPPAAGGTTNVGIVILKPELKEPMYSGIAFATGDRPRSLVVLDLNADGKMDIVTANGDSSDLSVLLGNGDGTFQTEKRLATGDGFFRGPTSLATGDLNHDGIMDLVTSNNYISNTVSVLLGNGEGSFQPQQRLAVGEFPNSAAVADVNADGWLDIVTANINSGDISVLLGNGDSTFKPEQRFPAGNGAFAGPVSVTVVDLNGDGHPDVVAGVRSSTDLSVLLGNGDGTFQVQQRVPAGIFAGSVSVGDLNGDGKPDLTVATTSSSNQISTLLGNGDGTFQAPQLLTVGVFPSSLVVLDINSDGMPDIVTANLNSGDISILLGTGAGTFQAEQRYAVNASPSALAFAKINGDSNLDLVLTNSSTKGPVTVMFGNGDGTFQTRQRLIVGTGPSWITVADLNLDGKQDFISVNTFSNDLSVLFGNGDATFQPEQRITVGAGPTSVAVADLDGDGFPDLIATNGTNANVSVVLASGGGTELRFAVGSSPAAVCVTDVNGDGKLDLVTANTYSSDVSVLLGNGDGTFQTQQRFAAISYPTSVSVGDLNGDGKVDLVTSTNGGGANNLAVLFGNGDGTFQLPQLLQVGSGTRGTALADVNGDGKLDIIAANNYSDDVSVLLGNGDGTFQPQLTIALGDVNPRAVKVADVDGDGNLDILTANDAGSISLLLGNGDGTFVSPQHFVTGGLSRSLYVADLNGDGKPDVVTADNLRNELSVLLHR